MRVLGIDPGTVSFDLCLLEDKEIVFEDSIPSTMDAEKPEAFAQECLDLNLDVMIAPSGMGLNNRRLSQLTQREMFELTLVREGEEVPVLEGMKKFLTIIREAGLEVFFLPLKPFGDTEISQGYYQQNMLTPREQEAAIEEIYSSGSQLDFFYDEPFLWNVAAEHGLAIDGSDSGVTIPEVEGCAAAYSLYIQTGGSVRPCMFCSEELTFGNAARESLAKIWERMSQSDTLTGWADQSQRKGNCQKCSQFESCRGCLARVAKLSGDALQADPCCPFAG